MGEPLAAEGMCHHSDTVAPSFPSLNLSSFFLYRGECRLAKEGCLYLKCLMSPICRMGGNLWDCGLLRAPAVHTA